MVVPIVSRASMAHHLPRQSRRRVLAPPARHYVPAVFVPGTRVRLLTEARKMPCVSWSLPARESCPHSVHTPGAICESCYADKGNYTRYKNVKRAQRARYEWAKACMRTAEGRAAFIAHMVATIRRIRSLRYFRVHDSGDFFNPVYVRCWTEIVRQLRRVRFWFPTRAHRAFTFNAGTAMAEIWSEALLELAALRNATVRPSADNFEDPAPMVPGLAAGSTACEAGFTCPAPQQGNYCRSCRACWDRPRVAVSYHRH